VPLARLLVPQSFAAPVAGPLLLLVGRFCPLAESLFLLSIEALPMRLQSLLSLELLLLMVENPPTWVRFFRGLAMQPLRELVATDGNFCLGFLLGGK